MRHDWALSWARARHFVWVNIIRIMLNAWYHCGWNAPLSKKRIFWCSKCNHSFFFFVSFGIVSFTSHRILYIHCYLVITTEKYRENENQIFVLIYYILFYKMLAKCVSRKAKIKKIYLIQMNQAVRLVMLQSMTFCLIPTRYDCRKSKSEDVL